MLEIASWVFAAAVVIWITCCAVAVIGDGHG